MQKMCETCETRKEYETIAKVCHHFSIPSHRKWKVLSEVLVIVLINRRPGNIKVFRLDVP